jgi:tRNA (guanine-N7-)-methyltransferase
MGKDKLRRFAENLTFDNMVQPSFDEIFHRDHALKGRWTADFFGAGPANGSDGDNPGSDTDKSDRTTTPGKPLVLELGCGKGEYTVGLGAANPDRNFLGIDIKGARMWRGAKTASELGLKNVGFLRTRIEFINSFFGPGEVSEIWITFPDPQLKKGREKKRLTSPVFLAYYAQFLAPDGVIHLKTDSREVHDYTRRVIEANALPCEACSEDISGVGAHPSAKADGNEPDDFSSHRELIPSDMKTLTSIQTAYERRFLEEGKPITYLRFRLPTDKIKFDDLVI